MKKVICDYCEKIAKRKIDDCIFCGESLEGE